MSVSLVMIQRFLLSEHRWAYFALVEFPFEVIKHCMSGILNKSRRISYNERAQNLLRSQIFPTCENLIALLAIEHHASVADFLMNCFDVTFHPVLVNHFFTNWALRMHSRWWIFVPLEMLL